MRWTVPAVGLFVVLTIPACGGQSESSVAVQVAVGEAHACAAFEDGSVRCWGERRQGQRGDGLTLSASKRDWLDSYNLRLQGETMAVPNQVINLTDAVELAAGDAHTCARRKDGTVWCWGPADQTGTNTNKTDQRVLFHPVQAEGVVDAVQLAAGNAHTCARRTDGSVWCWGDTPDRDPNWSGRGYMARPVPGVSGTLDIRVGGRTTCALLADGTVRCWGGNTEGQVGDGTVGSPTKVVANPTIIAHRDAATLSFGKEHICAISSAGKTSCWGGLSDARTRVPEGLALKTVAAGEENTCGLTADGALWCWGGNSLIEHLLPKWSRKENEKKTRIGGFPDAKQLVLGSHHACLRLDSGVVQCWGFSWRDDDKKRNEDATGPFLVNGLGKTIDIAGGARRTCAVVEDGTVKCWGNEKMLEPVVGVSDAIQVCHGTAHGCALRANGTVTCWGVGNRGQLGREPTKSEKKLPAATVAGLGAVEQLAASDQSTCARLKGGTVRCWGSNRQGELGQGYFSTGGTRSVSGKPLSVRLPRPAVALFGGRNAFCATLSDGAIACWGSNTYELVASKYREAKKKPPAPVSGVKDAKQIAAAKEHACALTKTGKVLCWGSNEHGQMGDGTWGDGNVRSTPVEIPALVGSTEVIVSYRATCGRMTGGRLMCVGGESEMRWEMPGLQPASQISLCQQRSSNIYGRDGEPDRPSGCAVMNNGALGCWGDSDPRSDIQRPEMGPPVQVRW